MRVVICSMGYTGYAAACWRYLAAMPDVVLKVYTPETHHNYSEEILDGIPVTVFQDKIFYSNGFAKKFGMMVANDRPDVIVIGGWSARPFKVLVYDKRFAGVRKLMAIDTMWEWNVRCLLSRWRLASLVKRLDGVIVAGERGRIFARYIGFRPEDIFVSTYGYDADAFSTCYEKRKNNPHGWPQRFVFVGRFVSSKGIDILLNAYRRYREWGERQQEDAKVWQLHCFGTGQLRNELSNVEGVVDRGFLQPKDLPDALVDAGVFVLPSKRDPWGVALAEGAGAGLPLIASDGVSSGIDLVRHMYNGYVFPSGSTEGLFRAFCWMHKNVKYLPEMGRRSCVYAAAYAPSVWTKRYCEALGII